MPSLGLIGGTGLDHWGEPVQTHAIRGDYGRPSAGLAEYHLGALRLFFLPRHGENHTIPPHAVNYRANIDAFRRLQVGGIVAVNAVGAISSRYVPGTLSVPDQLIDYTWGRAHSFSMNSGDSLQHAEFARPFSGRLHAGLINAAAVAQVNLAAGGCIGVTQGPRLETAAEIQRCKRDGCDLVGMTTMPEAALAREAGLDYASLCVHANWAAGLGDEPVTMAAIDATLKAAMVAARSVLATLFEELCHAN